MEIKNNEKLTKLERLEQALDTKLMVSGGVTLTCAALVLPVFKFLQTIQTNTVIKDVANQNPDDLIELLEPMVEHINEEFGGNLTAPQTNSASLKFAYDQPTIGNYENFDIVNTANENLMAQISNTLATPDVNSTLASTLSQFSQALDSNGAVSQVFFDHYHTLTQTAGLLDQTTLNSYCAICLGFAAIVAPFAISCLYTQHKISKLKKETRSIKPNKLAEKSSSAKQPTQTATSQQNTNKADSDFLIEK